MARAGINLQRRNFVAGINTESSALTFPENATIDESNFVLLRNGSRRRRLGLDFEQNHTLVDSGVLSSGVDTLGFSINKWENINTNVDVALLVVQFGNKFSFFDLLADTISAAPKNGGNTLDLPPSVIDPMRPVQMVGISGGLIIVGGSKTVVLVEYNADTDSVAFRQFNLEIRDFFGVDDSLNSDTRPATLSDEHKYNLLNQGWTNADITSFKTSQGKFPSNADIIYLGKNADGDFEAATLVKQFFENTPAPKGKFIIDAFDRGASRVLKSSGGFVTGTAGPFGFLGSRPDSEDLIEF